MLLHSLSLKIPWTASTVLFCAMDRPAQAKHIRYLEKMQTFNIVALYQGQSLICSSKSTRARTNMLPSASHV
jgi:hypothetical protein